MNSTALSAENIIFISEAHEKFFHEKLKEVRYQDAYHRALVYCLGISEDTVAVLPSCQEHIWQFYGHQQDQILLYGENSVSDL